MDPAPQWRAGSMNIPTVRGLSHKHHLDFLHVLTLQPRAALFVVIFHPAIAVSYAVFGVRTAVLSFVLQPGPAAYDIAFQ